MNTFLPVPLLRFFSKEEYLNNFLNDGEIFLTLVESFREHPAPNFRDEKEGKYEIKKDVTNQVGFETDPIKTIDRGIPRLVYAGQSTEITLPKAYALCATTSRASVVRKKKQYGARVNSIPLLASIIRECFEKEYERQFRALIGPINYIPNTDVFNDMDNPPYFTKSDVYKDDLEYRIVVPIPKDLNIEFQPNIKLYSDKIKTITERIELIKN